jgi:hypothetical protein
MSPAAVLSGMSTATTSADDTARPYREVQTGFVLLKLVTEVREDGVYVRLGPFQQSFRRIAFDEIEAVSDTSYDASDYGGWHWGLRVGPPGDTAYRLSGNRGVRIERAGGDAVFVGSQRSAELAAAIEDGLA